MSKKRGINMKKRYYSLYKGDVELAFGTKEEIAKKMGVKKRTVDFYNTPTYQKRGTGKKRRYLVEVK